MAGSDKICEADFRASTKTRHTASCVPRPSHRPALSWPSHAHPQPHCVPSPITQDGGSLLVIFLGLDPMGRRLPATVLRVLVCTWLPRSLSSVAGHSIDLSSHEGSFNFSVSSFDTVFFLYLVFYPALMSSPLRRDIWAARGNYFRLRLRTWRVTDCAAGGAGWRGECHVAVSGIFWFIPRI